MQFLISLFGPVTVIGLFTALFWQWRRLHSERRYFHTAIDRHLTGFWATLIGGVIAAMCVSLLTVLLGLFLPPAVCLWLTGLTVVALLLSGLGYSPWWLSLAGILAIVSAPLIPQLQLLLPKGTEWTWQFSMFVALLWAANGALLRLIDPPIDVPTIRSGPRGAKIAVYAHRQFYWLPLLVPVPGSWFAALPYWPTIGQGHERFALLVLPLIIGAAVRTRRQLPRTATHIWAWQYWLAGALLLVLAVINFFWPDLAMLWLGLAAVVGLGLGVANHLAARRGVSLISQTSTGVRLVAIQPDTPASKMDLNAGDIVLSCNGISVTSSAALYEAIQTQPTYCRLNVKRLDGEIKLTETAIYSGAPHELGMITFVEDLA